MPPLSVTMETGFSSNGFDLDDAIGVLGTAMQAVGPALGVDIDLDAIAKLASSLEGGRASGLAGVAQEVADGGPELLASIPGVDQLLAPLQRVVGTIQSVVADDKLIQLRSLGSAGAQASAGKPLGMETIGATASTVFGIADDPAIRELLGLIGRALPTPVDLPGAVTTVSSTGRAIGSLVKLFGGMMAIHSHSLAIRDDARLIRGLLPRDAVEPTAKRILDADARIAGSIAGIDPNDEAQIDAVVAPAVAFLNDLRTLAPAMVSGMAFSEATLVHSDPAVHIEDARRGGEMILSTDAAAVRALAIRVVDKALPFIPVMSGSPAESLEAMWGEVTAMVDSLTAAVAGFSTAPITTPVASAIGRVASLVEQVNRVIGEIIAAIRSAFEAVKRAIEAIGVQRVAEAIRSFLAPIGGALTTLQGILDGALGALQDAADELDEQIAPLLTAIDTGVGAIQGAFDKINDILDALQLENLVDGLRGGVNGVAEQLHAFQLQPFFDTSIQIMGTTADVLSLVPIDLLPDDTKGELKAKIKPIQDIQFKPQVADVLTGQLDAILDELDGEVLNDLQEAYDNVLQFLDSIDPAEGIANLEEQYFNPLIDRIDDIDPAALLEPVKNAIDSVREKLAELDVNEVIAPVEQVFDDILAGLDTINPATFLAEAEEQVDALRDKVVDLLGIDEWADRVDEVHKFFDDLLARLDLGALVPRLERAFDVFLSAVGNRTDDSTILGTILSALLEGTGLRLRPASFLAVAKWSGGEDGAAMVKALLREAIASLEEARAAAAAIDPIALSAAATPVYRAIAAAAETHAAGTRLRARLDPLLAGSAPLELFATMTENRTRYLGRLDAALAAVRSFASSGFSQVTVASQTARESLRPLAPLKDRLLAILRRFGIDAIGKDLRTILSQVLGFLRPNRALAPLVALVDAVRDKLREVLQDGLIAPVRDGVEQVTALVAALDIRFIRTELQSVFDQVRGDVEAFRPSVLLGDMLTAFNSLKAALVDSDPLAPVQEIIEQIQAAITQVMEQVKPSVVLAPVVEAYGRIGSAAGSLDVRALLEPVLAELRSIAAQLEQGLEGSGEAFGRLQQSLNGLQLSGSVTVGASS
jgi:hypothetical protein